MNWLFYIGGWFVFWAIFQGLFMPAEKETKYVAFKVVICTMLWVWICWKVI